MVIRTSSKDHYQITEDGPWITVAGDPAISTSGQSDWPCNIEGCQAGVMMFRFVGESGMDTVYVAGTELVLPLSTDTSTTASIAPSAVVPW